MVLIALMIALFAFTKAFATELLTWENQTTNLQWAYIEKQLDPNLTNQLNVNVSAGTPWSLAATSPNLNLSSTNGTGPARVQVSFTVTNNWATENFALTLSTPSQRGSAQIELSKDYGLDLFYLATDPSRDLFYGTQCKGDYTGNGLMTPLAVVEIDSNSGKPIRTRSVPFLQKSLIVNSNLDLLITFDTTSQGEAYAPSFAVYHLPDLGLLYHQTFSRGSASTIASAGNYIAFSLTNVVFLLDAQSFQMVTNYTGRNPWFTGNGSRLYFGTDTNLSVVDIGSNGSLDLRSFNDATAPIFVSPVGNRFIAENGILRGLDSSGAPLPLDTNPFKIASYDPVQAGHFTANGAFLLQGYSEWVDLDNRKGVRVHGTLSATPAEAFTRDQKRVAYQWAKEIRFLDFPQDPIFFFDIPLPTEIYIRTNHQVVGLLYDVTMANGPGTRADLYLYDYGEFIPQLPDAGKTVYSEYITPLSMEFSVGEYSLVLSNSFGMITSSVMRVRAVKAPEVFPAFETKISNLTSNLVLSAAFKTSPSVGGSDGQSIRWLKDGLPVGSRGIADRNILRIDNLQSNDEGIYTMEVSNASGKAVYTCVLKLLPAGESAPVSYPLKVPVITNTITNIVLLAGEPLVLVPSLLDMTEVKWQWFFKGDLLPGVTSSSLRLDHTSTLDSGNYSVTASNALGVSTAVIASVQVNPAPVSFTKTPPANVTLSVGSSFDIDFGLRGNPDTFYWFYNNQYVPWMTNYIWHFDSLQLTNSGSYFCLIPAPGGAIYSSIVNLTVGSGFPPTQHVPTIVVEQATNTLAVGSTKTLQAVITGDAPLSLQWFFNGDALTGSTGNTLVLTNLQVTNSGRYSLSAVNGAGSATSFVARLDVGYPPNFPIAFTNLLLIEGDSLDLRLIGPDVNTNLSTFSKDFENPRSGLGFQTDSIQRSDAGIYQVYSSNPYGTVTNTFSVFVCPRPGPVHAWGDNTFDQATVPDGLRAVAVAGGNNHSLALHRDGTAESWGVVTDSAFLAGHSNIVQISAEDDYTALLMADGTAAFWNEYSRVGFVTKMEDVRLAYMHVTKNGVVGITQLGGVVAFSNNVVITIIPDGSKLYRIGSSANLNYAFSLTGFTFFSVDGSRAPVVIGNNTYQDPPVDSAQGPLHSLELHRSGKVYAYGDNHFGQLSVPQNLENVLTVEAGLLHSYALQKNGVVRGWGDDTWGQISDIPTNVLFSAMASGGYHGLGIEGEFKLYIKKVGNNLILDWPFDQTLESSTSVLGPFHQAFNNGSPSTQAIGNGELYFRLRKYP